jgi:hypothetical protein
MRLSRLPHLALPCAQDSAKNKDPYHGQIRVRAVLVTTPDRQHTRHTGSHTDNESSPPCSYVAFATSPVFLNTIYTRTAAQATKFFVLVVYMYEGVHAASICCEQRAFAPKVDSWLYLHGKTQKRVVGVSLSNQVVGVGLCVVRAGHELGP